MATRGDTAAERVEHGEPPRGARPGILARLVRGAAGCFVFVAIFLAAGEIVARATGMADRVNGFPRALFAATDHPSLPYVMRPHVDIVVRHGAFEVRVRTNAFGMREREITPTPAPGVRRVLVLGDSATFGEGVASEEAFPAVLERELGRRAAAGDGRWEVLNAGVEGYNTVAEVAWLELYGLALRPHAVVVGFNLNDFDHAPVMNALGLLTRDLDQRIVASSPVHRSELLLLLRWLAWGPPGLPPAPQGLPPPPRRDGFTGLDRYVSALRKQYWAQPTDDRWHAMVAALARLRHLTAERGIDLLVAILPDGDQLNVSDPDLRPQQRMAALCADLGLPCLDLHPHFVASGIPNLHFDIMHPNAAGHRIVARVLADRLGGPAAPVPPSERTA